MRILFATDGSYHSDHALDTIVAQEWAEGSECLVVTVAAPFVGNGISRAQINWSLGQIGLMAADAEAALTADLQKMLAEITEKLAQKFGKSRVNAALREGDPAAIIIELANTWSADLIVMGAHGTSGYNDQANGSIITLVMNHAPCSVQIVNYISSASDQKKEKQHLPLEIESRFLLAINDSVNSQAVIDSVLSRTWPAESIFQILAVVPEPKSVFHSRYFKDPQIDQAHAKIYALQKANHEVLVKDAINKLVPKFGKQKITGHVLEGNVRSLILQIAQDWPADRILLGAHDRDKDMFEHFMGSVSQHVAQNAECSVEIVRKKA